MPAAPPNASYGIHALKSLCILGSAVFHAYIWIAIGYGDQAVSWPMFLLAPLAMLSAALPMTAMAVLQSRLSGAVDWYKTGAALFGLALLESCKNAFVYQKDAFFDWGALHCIALAIALVLFVSQFSILALWPLALAILFFAPSVTEAVRPYESEVWHKTYVDNEWPLVPVIHLLILASAFGLVVYGILQRSKMQRIYRNRLLTASGVLFMLGALSILRENTSAWAAHVIHSLPVGILVESGNELLHLWGVFPWAGVSILGLLVYRQVVRTNASPVWLATIFLFGAFLLSYELSQKATYHGLDPHQFLSTAAFRIQGAAYAAIGTFCFFLPLAYWFERTGLGGTFIRSMSQSILWLYLFQTGVMVFAYRWISAHFSYLPGACLIVMLMLIGCMVIPLLIARLPSRIVLRVEKVREA